MGTPILRSSHNERGVALLVVLIMLLALTVSSTSFIWSMNQQQTRAGVRYRSAAAMALAEAGVHRALSVLEEVPLDERSPGRTWRPAAYSETMQVGPLEGRFTLSLVDDSDGAVVVTSVGELGGVARRLRARIYLASKALLVAVYGTSVVRLDKSPAAIVILPYNATADYPWIDIASDVGIWFAGSGVPGTFNTATLLRPRPIRLLLSRGAGLQFDQQKFYGEWARSTGVNIAADVLVTEALPAIPEVDRVVYQRQALANIDNATLNEAAGNSLADADLASKRDSLYSQLEFEQLRSYLKTVSRPTWLRGVIYVRGGVYLDEGQKLRIVDGALIAEGTVYVDQAALLEVTHSAATRMLPGVITLDKGDLVVTNGGRLRVHGLVYASRTFDVNAWAHVDIVGSVLANGLGFSFSVLGATAMIRYDLAVLGTPGLRVPSGTPVIAWVAWWEELP